MARIRTIKPEFFTSLTIADLTAEQRLTFIGLWTHADDLGRCVDDPRLIKAALWPLDDRTAADVETDLRALTEASVITRYVFKAKRYLAVTGWSEHQKINRPSTSKLPGPADGEILPPDPPTSRNHESVNSHQQLTEDSLAERKGTGNREQGKEPPASRPPGGGRQTRGTHIPADFSVNAEMANWARDNAPSCGTADHEAFCDYWRGIPGAKGRKADWPATWRNWMRREHERRTSRASPRPGRPTPDQKAAEIQALKQQLNPQLNLIRGEIA